jgi:hypothetical protein
LVHYADGRVNKAASKRLSAAEFRACRTLEQKARYLQHFLLFSRRALLAVGGLDETIGNYPGIDDFDLIWTLLENGATVATVAKQLYHYRDHDGDRLTLQDPEKMIENLRRILHKHSVGKEEAQEIMRSHLPWFGRPIYKAMAGK